MVLLRKLNYSFVDKVKKFLRLADKWIDYEFVVGSHNVEKGSDSNGFYDTNVWYEIEKKYDIKNKLWKYVKDHIYWEDAAILGDGNYLIW